MKFKKGNTFEFDYPFYDQFMSEWQGKKETWLVPGCHKYEEREDMYYSVSYTANYEGKVVFEIISIAKMPGKYMDRLIVKKHYLLPCGKKFSAGILEMMTTGRLETFVQRNSVFPCDYEVEESATAD